MLRRVAELGETPSSYESPVDSPAPPSFKGHHFIANNRNNPISLFAFLQENDGDPAIKVKEIVARSASFNPSYDGC